MTTAAFNVRPAEPRDAGWIREFLVEHWSATQVVSRGRAHDADRLPAFVAEDSSGPLGLATYHCEAGECELVSLDSIAENRGIGSALVSAVERAARQAGCKRLWLITTNDNLRALRFYQKRGLVLAALYRNALDASRRLKPSIPLIGMDGIPLRDEIEFELLLTVRR